MEAFLKGEGKKINAVFAHNDGMAWAPSRPSRKRV